MTIFVISILLTVNLKLKYNKNRINKRRGCKIYKKINLEEATKFNKNGVNFIGYKPINDNMSFVIETVEEGHFEEFVHDKSTFTYIFLEGNGVFYLDNEAVEVKAGDVLSISPGTRIYYKGKLKQVLITTPAYDAKYERHIRNIEK